MPEADPWLPQRMRSKVLVTRGEARMAAAANAAIASYLGLMRNALFGSGGATTLTAAVAPASAWPGMEQWVAAVQGGIVPEAAGLFGEQFLATARSADISDQRARDQYALEVVNRLSSAKWPADAWETVRHEVAESVVNGESPQQLSSRLADLLEVNAASRELRARAAELRAVRDDPGSTAEQRRAARAELTGIYADLPAADRQWEGDTMRIARTELMGALNGGSYHGALAWQDASGEAQVKRWISTADARTRQTHRHADSQVRALGAPFEVGGAPLQFPGDPTGPAKEVIQCRCSVVYGPSETREQIDIPAPINAVDYQEWDQARREAEAALDQAKQDIQHELAKAGITDLPVPEYDDDAEQAAADAAEQAEQDRLDAEQAEQDRRDAEEIERAEREAAEHEAAEAARWQALEDEAVDADGGALDRIDDVDNWAAERGGQHNPAQVEALVEYTGNSYAQQNQALRALGREGQGSPYDPVTNSQMFDSRTYSGNVIYRSQDQADRAAWRTGQMDDAFNRATPTSGPVRVYRGVDRDALIPIFGRDHDLEGVEFTDSGYSSTAAAHGAAFSKPVRFEIYIPQGARVVYLGAVSRFPTEQEVLLPRGSRFRVMSQREEGRTMVLRVELIGGPAWQNSATTTSHPGGTFSLSPATLSFPTASGSWTSRSTTTRGLNASGQGQPTPQADGTWSGILAPLNQATGDGRMLAAPADGSTPRVRPLPLPLLYQDTLSEGHDGAYQVGVIDKVWTEGGNLMGSGRFDMDDPRAVEVVRKMRAGFLRFVSVDVDDRTDELVCLDADGNEVACPAAEDEAENLAVAQVVKFADWRLMGATMVSQPAFPDAAITMAADGDDELIDEMIDDEPDGDPECVITDPDDSAAWIEADCDLDDAVPYTVWVKANSGGKDKAEADNAPPFAVAASAAGAPTADAQWTPPAEWFADPELTGPTPIDVDPATGRVFGHLATWESCHIGSPAGPGVCISPPHSATGYALFHQSRQRTSAGVLPVGLLTMGTGHAALRKNATAAAAHYDNTGSQAAAVRAGEDAYGIWVAGAVLPDVTGGDRVRLGLARFSGDWRTVGGSLELVAALAVNTPGFPVTRRQTGEDNEEFSLVAAGFVPPSLPPSRTAAATVEITWTPEAVERFAADLEAAQDKRQRGAAARARFNASQQAARVAQVSVRAAAAVRRMGELSRVSSTLSKTAVLDRFEGLEFHPADLDVDPGPEEFNWVEKAGGLPPYIKRIEKHLRAQGMDESHAIAAAVNTVKRWCRGGQDVKPDTRAKACAAVASWDAKKAAS